MKKNIGILCFAFLIVSCKDKSALSHSKETFEQNITSDCAEFCPYAKLEIVLFDNKNQVSDSINTKIFEHFKEILSFEDEPHTVTDYNELLKSFLESYQKLQKEFPDESIGWEMDGTSEILFQNEKIINIKTEYYLYTGGAHGNSGVHSFFFDSKTGKNISKEKMFTDLNEFSRFAEKKFREKFNIRPESNINSTGFMFEDDVFHLPETILFTKKGILLLYNNYEIASYSDGQQELFIPFKEIKSLFITDFKIL